jgi:hypothetical protein
MQRHHSVTRRKIKDDDISVREEEEKILTKEGKQCMEN